MRRQPVDGPPAAHWSASDPGRSVTFQNRQTFLTASVTEPDQSWDRLGDARGDDATAFE